VTAALAMTTQDSNRMMILTRHAPARRGNAAGSRAGAPGRARSRPDLARRHEMAAPGCHLARTREAQSIHAGRLLAERHRAAGPGLAGTARFRGRPAGRLR
jgi:hypothetical protein